MSDRPKVLMIVTQDSKAAEARFVRECLEDCGVEVYHLDPSVRSLEESVPLYRDVLGLPFLGEEEDQYGHKKLGGISDKVGAALKEISPKYNDGRRVNVVNQRLGYLVRCGDPDALDAIVPMAFGNLALDLVLSGAKGRLVSLRNGVYDSVPIDVVTGRKKVVDIHKYYDSNRLRPRYKTFLRQPLFIMTSDV